MSEAHAGFEAGALRVSVGAATFPQDKADWAMYLAKRQGRDRVLSFRRKGDERG